MDRRTHARAVGVTVFSASDISRQVALSRAMYCLFGLAAGALLFTKVEVVVTAHGRLSSDNIQYFVDSPRDGQVEQVLVRSGDRVRRGTPLLRYDCAFEERVGELNALERLEIGQQLRKELDKAALILSSSQAKSLEDRLSQRANPLTASLSDEVARFRDRVEDMQTRTRLDDRKYALAEEMAQLERDRAERTLAQLRRERARLTELTERGSAAQVALEDATDAVADAEVILVTRALQIEDTEIERHRTRQVHRETWIEMQAEIVSRLTELDQRYTALEQIQAEQDSQRQLCSVIAPTDGEVFWLKDMSPNSFVESGDQLGKVVRTDVPIVAEAVLPENNIAFVAADQRANLRINGLPFVRYGILTGRVTFVSPDRAESDRSSGYTINLAVDDSPEWLIESGARLVPGMAIEADIVVGERRVIEYLTEPLQQAFQTAFREI